MEREPNLKTEHNPFFNLEDLQNIEIRIDATNLTSQIPMGVNDGPVQLVQIFSGGTILEVSPRSCAMGHTLELNFYIQLKSKAILDEIHVNAIGVIEEIEGLPAERKQIKIQFRKFDNVKWERVLQYYETKQKNMIQLLRATRG